MRTRLFRARALLREALERDLDTVTVDIFGFAGERCDRIVDGVLSRVATGTSNGPQPAVAHPAGNAAAALGHIQLHNDAVERVLLPRCKVH